MYSLVYVSAAVIPFSNVQLIELLQKSRENNEGLGITGMLLYKEGNFMQVLEGEEDSVLSLKARIAADSRHRGMAILRAGAIRHREFSDWSMGFSNLNSPDVLSIPGYSRFLSTPLTRDAFADHPAASKELLLLFKKSRS